VIREAGLIGLLVLLTVSPAIGADAKYMKDFEFLRTTVAENYDALKSKKIDWPRTCARMKPLFAAATDDVTHVKNVMMLLATLRDSHTGVTRINVESDAFPSKWDGLYGGGMWIGYDDGWFILMGLMEGHSLTGAIPLGSVIAAIDGVPMWLAMERERRRITKYAGTSSNHSLFSSMDNRLLPFRDKQSIEVLFLTPEGKLKKASVRRWGPGGKAFYPSSATMPVGLKWKEGAVSGFLDVPWCKKLGYLRITGSMDAKTVAAFHSAMDRLKGLEALLLDCRGMGGGGDGSAWKMAGRFYPGGVNNGLHGRIEASGDWQFEGPVVMLQDEKEISSAETFTWAMSETGRTISVGRPTGGWGIIPRGYSIPSGLASFRLGVNARPTPIKRIQTEGIGWPADVTVPCGPVMRAQADPVFDIGMQVLQVLNAGADVGKTRDLFAGLFEGRIAEFKKDADKLADVKGWRPKSLAKMVEQDLEKRLLLEALLLGLKEAGPPDVLGAVRRLEILGKQAKAAGMKSQVGKLEKAVKRLKNEAKAQEQFLSITDVSLGADADDRKSFLSRHKKSQIARFAREQLWK